MNFKKRTINQIADFICGNSEQEAPHFRYRSSSYLTEFFSDSETEYVHDGSTRKSWVADALEKILSENGVTAEPSETFRKVISVLMDQGDALNEGPERIGALKLLNAELSREGLEAFYGEDRICYLQKTDASVVFSIGKSKNRPLSPKEKIRRTALEEFLDECSEDELIEEVLVPLFQSLGFASVKANGHHDKSLEFGEDLWMKFTLPTGHVLYFGMQAKKGKLNTSGKGKPGGINVSEILNQVNMMLGKEIFDPETSRRVLVDHAIIACGGEITKAAKNWLGTQLDNTKRSQILFFSRDEIVDTFSKTALEVPRALNHFENTWF